MENFIKEKTKTSIVLSLEFDGLIKCNCNYIYKGSGLINRKSSVNSDIFRQITNWDLYERLIERCEKKIQETFIIHFSQAFVNLLINEIISTNLLNKKKKTKITKLILKEKKNELLFELFTRNLFFF